MESEITGPKRVRRIFILELKPKRFLISVSSLLNSSGGSFETSYMSVDAARRLVAPQARSGLRPTQTKGMAGSMKPTTS